MDESSAFLGLRKLIVLANTLIRENRLWKEDYAPAHA
jgi:hypothetical protein